MLIYYNCIFVFIFTDLCIISIVFIVSMFVISFILIIWYVIEWDSIFMRLFVIIFVIIYVFVVLFHFGAVEFVIIDSLSILIILINFLCFVIVFKLFSAFTITRFHTLILFTLFLYHTTFIFLHKFSISLHSPHTSPSSPYWFFKFPQSCPTAPYSPSSSPPQYPYT